MIAGTSKHENEDLSTDEDNETPANNENESIKKLQKKLLIKQISAAIAQEKAARAQEKAAKAQEEAAIAVGKAAGAVEQFVEDYFAKEHSCSLK